MSNFYTDVKDFHIAFGQRVGEKPELPNDLNERNLRYNLLKEEFEEFHSMSEQLEECPKCKEKGLPNHKPKRLINCVSKGVVELPNYPSVPSSDFAISNFPTPNTSPTSWTAT